jgi:hypothetical protein
MRGGINSLVFNPKGFGGTNPKAGWGVALRAGAASTQHSSMVTRRRKAPVDEHARNSEGSARPFSDSPGAHADSIRAPDRGGRSPREAGAAWAEALGRAARPQPSPFTR